MDPKQALGLVEWLEGQPEHYDQARPWNRQPCDTDEIWAAWRAYLTLPLPRQVKALHKRLSCTKTRAEMLMAEGAFAPRARAFDGYIHDLWKCQVKTVVLDHAVHYSKRHIKLLEKAEILLDLELRKLVEISESTEVATLKVADVSKLLTETIKNQRLLHDESTENIAAKITTHDASLLTYEETQAILRMQEKSRVKD